jgi:hypothetical protein
MSRSLRGLAVAGWAACAAMLMSSPVGGAAFTSSTSNPASTMSTLVVTPPTNVVGAMSLNFVPVGTCRVALTWTASTTPGVSGYEVVRVRASTGVVEAGPFTVAGTSYVDNPVPLQLIGSAYEWRVRSIRSSWRSAYQPATASNLAACLL